MDKKIKQKHFNSIHFKTKNADAICKKWLITQFEKKSGSAMKIDYCCVFYSRNTINFKRYLESDDSANRKKYREYYEH